MEHKMKTLTLLFLMGIFALGHAQRVKIPKWHSVQESHWQISVDYLAVDDSGRFVQDPLNISDHWNILAYPSRFSFSRRTSNNFSFDLMGAYAVYQEGKIIDGSAYDRNTNYWSFDINANYHFHNILGWSRVFDPFLGLGIGYTRANKIDQATINTRAGAYIWIFDRMAIQLSTIGKMSLASQGTNHLVHSAGLVFRFGME